VRRGCDRSSSPTIRAAWLVLLVFISAACAVLGGQASRPPERLSGPTSERLEQLGGELCEPESKYICVEINSPLDPSQPDGKQIALTFAVRPAPGERAGVLVVAVGGPGGSGVEESAWRFTSLDPVILSTFDIVFFNQRGVDLATELECPQATDRNGEDWAELSDDWTWQDLAEVEHRWVKRCINEVGRPDVVPFLSTADAITDLELFRKVMGYDKLVIYGESYGTAFAQAYAQAYPQAVKRIVLDGPVDRTLDSNRLTVSRAAGLGSTLSLVFSACDEDPSCTNDMGAPAQKAYDRVMARLESVPVSASIQTLPGEWEEASLSSSELSSVAFSSVYSEDDRRLFLRALAAGASRGDFIPLLRLANADPFSDLSTVVHYGVNCLDMVIPGVTAEAEVRSIEIVWGEVEVNGWLASSNLACAFWPGVDHSNSAPPAFLGKGIPTMVVAATADPTTPFTQARSVLNRLDDEWMLTVDGGSHVMFGRGDVCVDPAVTKFILGDSVDRELTCEAEVIAPYLPLIPASIDRAPIEDLLEAIDNEIYLRPEWFYHFEEDDLGVGCSYGGSATFSFTESGAAYVLDECAFTSTFVVSGEGRWDYDRGTSIMRVELSGFDCPYTYQHAWESHYGRAMEDCS
jgi:pimeloyl-ACP methyl ester carboxylesterase